MLKALVTGANGFVGSHLTTFLAKKGYKVKALILKGTDIQLLTQLHPTLKNVTIIEGDILDYGNLRNHVESMDYIFHLAGVIRGYTQQEYDRVNVIGTRNIIKACCDFNSDLKRLVLVSSIVATKPGTIDKPTCEEDPAEPAIRDFYGVSKNKMERFAISCYDRLPISIVRPTSVIGPGDKVSLDLFKIAKFGIKLRFPGKKRYYNFIDVEDLVDSIHLCAIHEKAVGEIFHIGGERIITWEDLQEMIGYYIFNRKYGSLLGLFVPNFLVIFISKVMELFYKAFKKPAPFFNRSKAQNTIALSNVCSTEKIKRLLGWTPKYSYPSMVKRAGIWAKQNGMI